jgi:peptidyl-prolyl cis-trans isomerase C
MNRSKQIILAAGLLTVWLLTAPSAARAADAKPETKPADRIAELFGNDVVAKGTGMEIKRSQLDAAVMGIKASGAARGQQLNSEQSMMLERQVLDRLMQIELLNDKATEADKAKGQEESKKRFEIIQKRAGSEETLARQLKSVGMSVEELNRKMTEEAIAEAVVVRELKADATDEEAKKYYDEHPARFEQPEMVRASHILLSILDSTSNPPTPLPDEKKQAKRKLAEDLLKRARAGEDFAKLAKEYSEDPGSRDKGGEYKFPRGQMVPEFESAAYALDINQISDIVTTQFGYHIIKLSEKIPARKLALDEVVEDNKISDQVKDVLKRQKLEKLLPDFIAKLQADAKVEVLDAKLKKAGEMIEAARAESAAAKANEEKPAEKK